MTVSRNSRLAALLLACLSCAQAPSNGASHAPDAAPRLTPLAQRGGRPTVPTGASPQTLAILRQGLSANDWMTRMTATAAIACIPGPEVLGWLEERLADVEEDIRAEATLALARRPEPRARTLLQSVQDDTQEVLSLRVLAASALARPSVPCQPQPERPTL